MDLIGKIVSAAVLAAGAAAVGIVAKKKNSADFCPECDIKKAIANAGVHIEAAKTYDNGVALTPPMGWSSWNSFRNNIDENLIKETADAMKKCGLLDAGYCYVNLDDCWQSSMRDGKGRLQGDLKAFPSGIKSLVKDLNKKGFKVGIYSSNGTLTCEDLPASLGNERIDAETFAEWGIEYFKYDFCHNEKIPTEAPLIEKLIISDKSGNETAALEARNAELYGTAAVLGEGEDSYVGRLDNAMGSIRFSFVNIKADGEYVLTVVFRKNGDKLKYAELTVNGDNVYKTYFPPTKAWSHSGRVQLVVSLKAGDNTIEIKNPIGSKMDSAAKQYIEMGEELKRATRLYAEKHNTPEKPIVYSICEWGLNKPWKWGAEAGNLWRTTPDIKPFWASILGIYEVNVKLYKHSSKGCWNDPDMLEVGNGNLSVNENKAHFSLWCMMAAPLILGNDIRKFINSDGTVNYADKTLQIITNKDLIAVNQDKKGVQCRRVRTNLLTDILVKPLENGEIALCFFNKAPAAMNIKIRMSDITNLSFVDMPSAKQYECFDLWSKERITFTNELSATVDPHSAEVFRIKAL